MCINFYIQHRIFKRRRIDCHTADGVTTTALASRRRAVVGAVDRPLARDPDRPDPDVASTDAQTRQTRDRRCQRRPEENDRGNVHQNRTTSADPPSPPPPQRGGPSGIPLR